MTYWLIYVGVAVSSSISTILCHCSISCELEWARDMALGNISGNDVLILPKKYDFNQPDGGTVINSQKLWTLKDQPLHTVSLYDLKSGRYTSQSILQKSLLDKKCCHDGFFCIIQFLFSRRGLLVLQSYSLLQQPSSTAQHFTAYESVWKWYYLVVP